jgi:hypothetical protein
MIRAALAGRGARVVCGKLVRRQTLTQQRTARERHFRGRALAAHSAEDVFYTKRKLCWKGLQRGPDTSTYDRLEL